MSERGGQLRPHVSYHWLCLVLLTGSLLLQSLPPKRDGQEAVDMVVGHSTPSSIPEESEEESAQPTSDPSKKEE